MDTKALEIAVNIAIFAISLFIIFIVSGTAYGIYLLFAATGGE